MKKIILLVLVAALSLSKNGAIAGEFGFEDKAEGMVKALLKPTTDSPGEFRLRGGSGSTRVRTRGVRVIERRPNRRLATKIIHVPEQRVGGFVNVKVLFDVDSHALRPESIGVLDEMAKALKDPRLLGRSFFVNGHTDSDGSDDYNLRLSFNRANAVLSYLVTNGRVSAAVIKVMGYGEALPIAPNVSKANKQLNRRVEIVLGE